MTNHFASCIILIHILPLFLAVDFVFPDGQFPSYTGFIWNGASKVHLSPRLQAVTKEGISQSREICRINIYDIDGGRSKFYTRITDRKNGFADVFLDESTRDLLRSISTFVLSLEALDCDSPPHISNRVPLTIHVINQDGPVFDQPSYRFTVSQQSYKGTVVGTVQAIPQVKDTENAVASAICSYQIQPLESPFSIDRYGVIRVQEKLHGNQPYMFRVTAEDCRRPTPRKTTVDVMVKQIGEGCQPGWKGIPSYLEYSGGVYTPGNLLHAYKLKLDTCAGSCPDAAVEARLELKSALLGYKLTAASSEACLHDPEHLSAQRSLCDIYPATFTSLLPDPDKDIVAQLTGPALGNPPRLVAPSRQWRFEAQVNSVWETDARNLNNDSQTNAFDSEFTISFWLVRQPSASPPPGSTVEDIEETVVCSQDQEEASWRFMSVSFRNCHLIVRLMASFQQPMSATDNEPRKATVWTFGPFPNEYCRPVNLNQVTWHHYAITFSRNPWGATSEMVSILIDGQTLEDLGAPVETTRSTDPPYIPSERRAKPKITVGACYDPTTHLTRQHLNGELAGFTLLLGKTEPANNLRCLAQCGESLLVPNVLKYLREDITVNLTNTAITVLGKDVNHVADLLRAIAYIRTQPQVSPDFTASVSQTRNLTLTTLYKCSPNEPVAIPSSNIQLYIPKLINLSPHGVQVAHPLSSGSEWMPHGGAFDRPPISQASVEQRARDASKKQIEGSNTPTLLIQGSDIIITELPINDFGIPIFSDVKFVVPREDNGDFSSSNSQNAAGVLLDSCHVWIVSSGDPNIESTDSKSSTEDRIEWSLAQIIGMGLKGKNDRYGVQLSGRKPAGDYEQALHTMHYVPSGLIASVRNGAQNHVNSGTEYVATIGLVCSMDYGKQSSQFYVKVIIESPESAKVHLASNEAIERLSPDSQQQSFAHLAQSDQEKRTLNERLRPLKDEHSHMKLLQSNAVGRSDPFMITGIIIAVILVVVLISLLVTALVRNQQRTHRPAQPDRRRPFAKTPADFGGASLKLDPTLRLTANPVGEMEYTGLGIVSENLYGSYSNLTANQYIFSPPTSRKRGSCGSGPHLAQLDEFDEDYLDQADEELFDTEDGHATSEQSISNGEHVHPLEPQSVMVNCPGSQIYRADDYDVDVHEWMDDEPEQLPECNQGAWDLVSHCPPSKNGPEPVDV